MKGLVFSAPEILALSPKVFAEILGEPSLTWMDESLEILESVYAPIHQRRDVLNNFLLSLDAYLRLLAQSKFEPYLSIPFIISFSPSSI